MFLLLAGGGGGDKSSTQQASLLGSAIVPEIADWSGQASLHDRPNSLFCIPGPSICQEHRIQVHPPHPLKKKEKPTKPN